MFEYVGYSNNRYLLELYAANDFRHVDVSINH